VLVRVTRTGVDAVSVGDLLGVALGVSEGVKGGGAALSSSSPPQAVIDNARATASAINLVTGPPGLD
jgi:hypothetical protein